MHSGGAGLSTKRYTSPESVKDEVVAQKKNVFLRHKTSDVIADSKTTLQLLLIFYLVASLLSIVYNKTNEKHSMQHAGRSGAKIHLSGGSHCFVQLFR